MNKYRPYMDKRKYMSRIVMGCFLLSCPFCMIAQTLSNDSVSRTIALDEVTIVVASNVSRVDNHLVIYPN